MNGFKRALRRRRQATVVGLAMLMGATVLGCHTGPRLFTKRDRGDRSSQQAFAERDRGKFINRKKGRPEADYRRDEPNEQVAKSDNARKGSSKDSPRPAASSSSDRTVASRKPTSSSEGAAERTQKSMPLAMANQPPADVPQRSVTDLLDESTLFDDVLPETTVTARRSGDAKSVARTRPDSAAPLDQDPFKNSVVGRSTSQRLASSVSTVNFDDEDADELEEEAEELAELHALSNHRRVAPNESKDSASERRGWAAPLAGKQKYLDEFEESLDDSAATKRVIDDSRSPNLTEKSAAKPMHASERPNAAKAVAGHSVIDRRQAVQDTLDDWRRELDQDESLLEGNPETVAPSLKTAAKLDSSSVANGHLSSASIEEFAPPSKAAGAVLNGELIIDTRSLPSRFQRGLGSPTATEPAPSKGGKVNSNSGAMIDIVPGATQNRSRSSGQISLQSLSDDVDSLGLITADFEQDSGPADDLSGQTDFERMAELATGPKLTAASEVPLPAAAPPSDVESPTGLSVDAPPSGVRRWKRSILVLGAMLSAVAIGCGLRRRLDCVPAPVREFESNSSSDPTTWPRG